MLRGQISKLASYIKARPKHRELTKRCLHLIGLEWVHWSRAVMIQTLEDHVRGLDYRQFDALEISGSQWEPFGFRSYQMVGYPEFDICRGPLPNAHFDIVFAEQVFEHIRYPQRGATHVLEMLKPGGRFIITTPFLYKVHPAPLDCWRWTQQGMKFMLEDAGFPADSITTGSWGNRPCVNANMAGIPHYHRWFHSLCNDPDLPIMVWAIAQKPHRN